MHPVTSSRTESRPDERRRNLRHRVPSIMYAQFGSENGGVVVNLGIDGIACQTAMRMVAEQNSTVPLRLRGAGLNLELDGEIVWLSATQKKVGIRFKTLSAEARKEIADWITRETQLFGPVGLESESRPGAMSAMPGTSATAENASSNSLSAALSKSRSDAANPLPKLESGADANPSRLPSPLVSATAKSNSAPLTPNDSLRPRRDIPADAVDSLIRVRDSESASRLQEFRAEWPVHDDALFEPISIDTPFQFPSYKPALQAPPETATPAVEQELPRPSVVRPVESETRKTEGPIPARPQPSAVNSRSIALPEKSAPLADEERSRPSSDRPAKTEVRKAQETRPVRPLSPAGNSFPTVRSDRPPTPAGAGIAKAPAESPRKSELAKTSDLAAVQPATGHSQPVAADKSAKPTAADRWIPPALLDVWRKGGPQQRALLAAVGTVCAGSFVLLVILTLVRITNSTSPSTASAPVLTTANAPNYLVRTFTTPIFPQPAATDPDEASSASLFGFLVNKFLGNNDSDLPEWIRPAIAIDPQHVAVPVWTSKSNGYYYCTDSEYYKTVQPGSFMNQRDALQNGYQPKLGKFCN